MFARRLCLVPHAGLAFVQTVRKHRVYAHGAREKLLFDARTRHTDERNEPRPDENNTSIEQMSRKDKRKKRTTTKKRLKKREAEDEEIYKTYDADDNNKRAIPSNGRRKNQNHVTTSHQSMQTYERPSYTYENKHSKTKASTAAGG